MLSHWTTRVLSRVRSATRCCARPWMHGTLIQRGPAGHCRYRTRRLHRVPLCRGSLLQACNCDADAPLAHDSVISAVEAVVSPASPDEEIDAEVRLRGIHLVGGCDSEPAAKPSFQTYHGVASTRTSIRDASVQTLPRRGSKRAYSALGSRGSAPAVAPAAPNVVRAANHFPHISHVQYPIYFWNIHMQQL
jgi:hypothetical protein